ncbi:MAG: right-handed parallel beta-helix repeat-containing protein [Candidatus Odinarchaeota archaeon]
MKRAYIILLLWVIFGIGCGSDSNKESSSYPVLPVGPTKTLDVPGMYKTIQKAIDAAGTGDFIRVDIGVYSEDLVIESKSFSLRGAGRGQTVIHGSVKIFNTSETSLEGFTIRGGGIYAINSPVRITGNEIIDSSGAGVRIENCPGFMISSNEIRNNGWEGIWVDDSPGIIGSNIVTQNKADGIVINNSSPGLAGNTITSNGRDGVSIRGFTYYSAPELIENTIQNNGGVSNYDIICFGGNTNPTGSGNIFGRCMNCVECRSFGMPVTYRN